MKRSETKQNKAIEVPHRPYIGHGDATSPFINQLQFRKFSAEVSG